MLVLTGLTTPPSYPDNRLSSPKEEEEEEEEEDTNHSKAFAIQDTRFLRFIVSRSLSTLPDSIFGNTNNKEVVLA